MKKRIFLVALGILLCLCLFLRLLSFFSRGCWDKKLLDPKNPVIVTIWHNYGGPMKYTMDELIDEFNETVGAEKGIILSITSISGSATLHEKLVMAANKDPGAPQFPDITTVYPKTAVILGEKNLLADLEEQFSADELCAYVPQFLEEGRLGEDRLYVFPTAKSTEVLFVNKTVFDRFAYETEISYDDLRTFEGIIKTAAIYKEWTDRQTPEVKDDGKTFFMADSLFNLALVGCKQLGEDFLQDSQINLSSPAFARVWQFFYESVIQDYVSTFPGYAADLMKTGDIVCALGSTAGVLFYPPTVTYANNITEPVEYDILPYPVFEGGKKVAMQRGSGMCVIKSTREKEYAAGIFLKWFTEPEQNLRFVSSTGYLPVTKEAFGEVMQKEVERVSNPSIRELLNTAMEMYKEYDFYIPPVFDEYDDIQKEFEQDLKVIASEARENYLELIKHMPDKAALEAVKAKGDRSLSTGDW